MIWSNMSNKECEKMSGFRVCVDFDGTLSRCTNWPELGEPIEGAREAMIALKEMGATIMIHTCRTSEEVSKHLIDRVVQVKKIEEWCTRHDIPFDYVAMANKPVATFYVDDAAIRFENNWDEVVRQIKEKCDG